MEDLSFTHLDHESIVSFDDLDAIVESHARVAPPPAYRAASLLDGLSAYAALFPCAGGCATTKA